jgi:tetratricopeptide (TPR) repeat protein
MKKISILLIAIVFVVSSFLLYPNRKDRASLYMSALTERNQVKKFQKLEEYFTKYTKNGKKVKNITSTLYIQLVETSLKAKKFDKTVFYAEKALKCEKLSDGDKLDVKMALVRYYAFVKKDTDSMNKLIEEIKSCKTKDKIQNFDSIYLTQIQKIQIAMSTSDTKTVESTKTHMLEAFKLYESNPSEQNAKIIYFFAKKLYDEFDSPEDAVLGLEKICSSEEANIKYIDILARWYKADDKYEEAVKYLIKSYTIKADSKKAYNIAYVFSELDADKAMAYYAESIVRGTDKVYVDKSREKLTKLYKEEKGEGLSEEELTQEIEKIIEEAKNRLKTDN